MIDDNFINLDKYQLILVRYNEINENKCITEYYIAKTEKIMSKELGITSGTLRNYRLRGQLPKNIRYTKINGNLYYVKLISKKIL